MFRYCDDLVICCQYDSDAIRVHKGLGNRLTRFGLKLNEEKTRMVSFSKEKQDRGIKQESFDFLSFTFFFGKSTKGFVIPKLKTSRKRFVSKLKKVTSWMRTNRSRHRLPDLWKSFCAKVRGHVAYYGGGLQGTRRIQVYPRGYAYLFQMPQQMQRKKTPELGQVKPIHETPTPRPKS